MKPARANVASSLNIIYDLFKYQFLFMMNEFNSKLFVTISAVISTVSVVFLFSSSQ